MKYTQVKAILGPYVLPANYTDEEAAQFKQEHKDFRHALPDGTTLSTYHCHDTDAERWIGITEDKIIEPSDTPDDTQSSYHRQCQEYGFSKADANKTKYEWVSSDEPSSESTMNAGYDGSRRGPRVGCPLKALEGFRKSIGDGYNIVMRKTAKGEFWFAVPIVADHEDGQEFSNHAHPDKLSRKSKQGWAADQARMEKLEADLEDVKHHTDNATKQLFLRRVDEHTMKRANRIEELEKRVEALEGFVQDIADSNLIIDIPKAAKRAIAFKEKD